MKSLVTIADKTIPFHKQKYDFVGEGKTDDIVREVLRGDKLSHAFLYELSQAIKGKTLEQTAFNIWKFIKHNIKYKEDEWGEQLIKTPSSLWWSKIGDCKSFSIFTATILKHLGIPHKYRFSSYESSKRIQHVYVVIPLRYGKEIIIDAVWDKPNAERKDYTYKKDIMTKIYQVSGVGTTRKKGELDLGDMTQLSDESLDLHIMRQRLEIEQQIVDRVRGIGTAKSEGYDKMLSTVNDALSILENPHVSDQQKARDLEAYAVAGIGQAYYDSDSIGGFGSWVKKAVKNVGNTVKKGFQAVTRVISAPFRLLIKGILQVTLPKVSMFFLYLWVNNPSTLNAKGRKKRDKALKIESLIVDKIKMKKSHFRGLVKNGIMKKAGKTPEAILKQRGISGIGAFPLALIPIIVTMLKKLLGNKAPGVSAEDAPTPEQDFVDWGAELSTGGGNPTQSQYQGGGNTYMDPQTGIPRRNGGSTRGWCG